MSFFFDNEAPFGFGDWGTTFGGNQENDKLNMNSISSSQSVMPKISQSSLTSQVMNEDENSFSSTTPDFHNKNNRNIRTNNVSFCTTFGQDGITLVTVASLHHAYEKQGNDSSSDDFHVSKLKNGAHDGQGLQVHGRPIGVVSVAGWITEKEIKESEIRIVLGDGTGLIDVTCGESQYNNSCPSISFFQSKKMKKIKSYIHLGHLRKLECKSEDAREKIEDCFVLGNLIIVTGTVSRDDRQKKLFLEAINFTSIVDPCVYAELLTLKYALNSAFDASSPSRTCVVNDQVDISRESSEMTIVDDLKEYILTRIEEFPSRAVKRSVLLRQKLKSSSDRMYTSKEISALIDELVDDCELLSCGETVAIP